MSHQIFISIGSNIDRTVNTQAAKAALEQHFSDLVCSQVYESEAIGFNGAPFYNWVASATTNRALTEVVSTLKRIESDNGRTRSLEKFASRTLDLDLLLYDNKVASEPVELPRGEILYNAFVLQPLAEIAPDGIHPVCHKTYSQLWQDFDKTKQRLWPISFAWSNTK